MVNLRFGISHRHGGPAVLEAAQGFIDLLARVGGAPARVVVVSDYEGLLEGLLAGTVDAAWLPPLLHVRATGRGARLAALCQRRGELTYRSALVVRRESRYRALRDLAGARPAWVDSSSASGYVWPRLRLAAAGVDPDRDLGPTTFVGSSSLACAAVASGGADFCGCHVPSAAGDLGFALAAVEQSTGAPAAELRVLEVTDEIPPDGVVLSVGLEAGRQDRVSALLHGLHLAPGGPEALAALFNAERLVPVSPELLPVLAALASQLRAAAAVPGSR